MTVFIEKFLEKMPLPKDENAPDHRPIVRRINSNRADTLRKYVLFNYELPGNFIIMRQICQIQLADTQHKARGSLKIGLARN